MGDTAFVFPGQGSQYVGMGEALAGASPAAAAVFAEADGALGSPISQLAWRGPAQELDQTVNAQPAILATSIAYLRALEERWATGGVTPVRPRFCAGHSMGQYSAMVAAGALSLADGVRLVRERGRLMQASAADADGAMAAIIGLDEAALPGVLAAGESAGTVVLANDNAPGQIVVSGERPAVAAALEAARAAGARRTIELAVSVAAHSPLMANAAAGMARALAPIAFADPTVPLLANAGAESITTGPAARRELVDHLTTGVAWTRAVRAMAAAGVTTILEIGPGRVLTGLNRRIVPLASSLALDDPSVPDRLAVPELVLRTT